MQIQLPELNFPAMDFRLKKDNGKAQIFDPCRKKFVALSPEEWVRQHCISFLHIFKSVPLSLISVEKALNINTMVLRYDIVVYSKTMVPILLVECKAPEIKISPSTFDQIAAYNLQLKVPFLFVTNGLDHFFCQVDFDNSRVFFIKDLPDYNSMITIPSA